MPALGNGFSISIGHDLSCRRLQIHASVATSRLPYFARWLACKHNQCKTLVSVLAPKRKITQVFTLPSGVWITSIHKHTHTHAHTNTHTHTHTHTHTQHTHTRAYSVGKCTLHTATCVRVHKSITHPYISCSDCCIMLCWSWSVVVLVVVECCCCIPY